MSEILASCLIGQLATSEQLCRFSLVVADLTVACGELLALGFGRFKPLGLLWVEPAEARVRILRVTRSCWAPNSKVPSNSQNWALCLPVGRWSVSQVNRAGLH